MPFGTFSVTMLIKEDAVTSIVFHLSSTQVVVNAELLEGLSKPGVISAAFPGKVPADEISIYFEVGDSYIVEFPEGTPEDRYQYFRDIAKITLSAGFEVSATISSFRDHRPVDET